MKITKYFKDPKIISIIGDVNEAKSNLVYYLINELKKEFDFNLSTYGLKANIESNKFYTIEELEKIKESIIFIDEFQSLFDLDDRKRKKQIENTLRLINHNNNVLVLVGTPDNFKKFISSKITVIFYKRVTFDSFINGSTVKKNVLNYCGDESGSSVLNLEKNETICFDSSYKKYIIDYIENCDTKRDNKEILKSKSGNIVPKKVE